MFHVQGHASRFSKSPWPPEAKKAVNFGIKNKLIF